MEGWAVEHNVKRTTKVQYQPGSFYLVQWFQVRRFICESLRRTTE